MSSTINETAKKASVFSIITNTALACIKWLAGYFGNSYALIADAIESTADILSSALVFLGLKYASKPADEDHPYGHGRIEPLVTFAVVGFLIVSATIIAYESVENIRTPHDPPKSFTLIVLGAIILWKELSYQYVVRKSKETGSTSLKADAWHHRSDAITSVAAFIGITIALVMGEGFEQADDWAALFASGMILYNSYLILKPALGEIMDKNMYDDMIVSIIEKAKEVEGVIDVETCHVRKTGMSYFIDMHIIVDKNITVKEGHDIAHALKRYLKDYNPQIADVLIHVEPCR